MNALPLLRVIRTLTPPAIEELLARDRVIRRAQAYAAEGRVDEVWVDGRALRSHVAGSSDTPYHTVMRLIDGEIEAECSCPYERGVCWHAGAVLLALVAEPELLDELEQQAGRFVGRRASDEGSPEGGAEEASGPEPLEEPAAQAPVRTGAEREKAIDELRDELLGWNKLDAIELLAGIAVDDPLMESKIRSHTGDASNLDIRLYRQATRSALRPGSRPGRYELPRMVHDLREILDSVRRLIAGSQPEAALALMQEMAWLAWARIAEVEDRDAVLRDFVREVLSRWCQSWSEVEGRDRQVLARELFGWIVEDGSGLTRGLVHEAAEALGPMGLQTLSALLKPLEERRKASRPLALKGGDEWEHRDPLLERIHVALREIAEVEGDAEAFLSLCDPSGEHGDDLLAAARRFERLGHLDEALDWAERGPRRAVGRARAELESLRISLLQRQGRLREAIDAAWEVLVAEPSADAYHRLMGVVAEGDKGEWRRRAIDHAEAGSDATGFVEICVAADERERLLHRLDGSPSYVFSASPAALEGASRLLARTDPAAAARIPSHLASQILARGDSREYGRARTLLERTKRILERAGSRGIWEETLDRIREAHPVVGSWFD